MRMLPIYPVYIPSKGRADNCLTAKALVRDGVPFRLVVEPKEREAYAAQFGAKNLLILPFGNLGKGSIPARNWIKDHSIVEGHKRHWQLDDNMGDFYRVFRGKRIYCNAGIALRVCEDFSDRYENVAISGLNYCMFFTGHRKVPPFYLNVHVYSCTLILNSIPYRWRGRYNEDTDLCLQALAGGWCTILLNAFLVRKMQTMKMTGGNSDKLYKGDGRLTMARSLERVWPGVVHTSRRFKRPQHIVKNAWGKFDNVLIPREGLAVPHGVNEYGMEMSQKGEIRSAKIRKLFREHRRICAR